MSISHTFSALYADPFIRANLLLVAAIFAWIVASMILSAPSLNVVMRAGWIALSAFGFSWSLLLSIGSAFALRTFLRDSKGGQ